MKQDHRDNQEKEVLADHEVHRENVDHRERLENKVPLVGQVIEGCQVFPDHQVSQEAEDHQVGVESEDHPDQRVNQDPKAIKA